MTPSACWIWVVVYSMSCAQQVPLQLAVPGFPQWTSRLFCATKQSFMGKLQETGWPFTFSSQVKHKYVQLCLCVSRSVFMFSWVLSALSIPEGKPDICPEFLGESHWGGSSWLLEIPRCREDTCFPTWSGQWLGTKGVGRCGSSCQILRGHMWPYHGAEHQGLLGVWGSKAGVDELAFSFSVKFSPGSLSEKSRTGSKFWADIWCSGSNM